MQTNRSQADFQFFDVDAGALPAVNDPDERLAYRDYWQKLETIYAEIAEAAHKGNIFSRAVHSIHHGRHESVSAVIDPAAIRRLERIDYYSFKEIKPIQEFDFKQLDQPPTPLSDDEIQGWLFEVGPGTTFETPEPDANPWAQSVDDLLADVKAEAEEGEGITLSDADWGAARLVLETLKAVGAPQPDACPIENHTISIDYQSLELRSSVALVTAPDQKLYVYVVSPTAKKRGTFSTSSDEFLRFALDGLRDLGLA